MDTKIHFTLGFKLEGIFFGYHDGVLYQLPYMAGNQYYSLRVVKLKTLKNGWQYYHVRRKKFGVAKIRAMLQTVSWQVNKPADI